MAENRVIYTVWPIKDQTLHPGHVYLVVDTFPPNVRLVLLRCRGFYGAEGYVEGDGAVSIRDRGVRELLMGRVSDISGCGQAEAVED